MHEHKIWGKKITYSHLNQMVVDHFLMKIQRNVPINELVRKGRLSVRGLNKNQVGRVGSNINDFSRKCDLIIMSHTKSKNFYSFTNKSPGPIAWKKQGKLKYK